MNKYLVFFIFSIPTIFFISPSCATEPAQIINSTDEKIGYTCGVTTGNNLISLFPGLDHVSICKSIGDLYEEKEISISREEELKIKRYYSQIGHSAKKSKVSRPYDRTQISYALGLDYGRKIKSELPKLDLVGFCHGISDITQGNDLVLSANEMQHFRKIIQQTIQNNKRHRKEAVSKKNFDDGMKFLEQNRKNKDIITLDNNLQYRIKKKGTGPIPSKNDSVTLHYIGSFINGTIFESTYLNQEPKTFSMKDVMPGWRKILSIMPEGSSYQVFLPSYFAYGKAGNAKRKIKPNSFLIYELNLLHID